MSSARGSCRTRCTRKALMALVVKHHLLRPPQFRSLKLHPRPKSQKCRTGCCFPLWMRLRYLLELMMDMLSMLLSTWFDTFCRCSMHQQLQLRAAGAFLVSSKRVGNITQFVRFVSKAGSDCVLRSDMPSPWTSDPPVSIKMIVCILRATLR